MSYREALEAAGAEVQEFESFGSYQGDWWARVVYKGREGWVHGGYGSCTGCDAFQSEFWDPRDTHRHGDQYISETSPEDWTPETCAICAEMQTRLREFGERYLDDILTQEEAEQEASRHLSWDLDAREVVDWLKAHAISPAPDAPSASVTVEPVRYSDTITFRVEISGLALAVAQSPDDWKNDVLAAVRRKLDGLDVVC